MSFRCNLFIALNLFIQSLIAWNTLSKLTFHVKFVTQIIELSFLVFYHCSKISYQCLLSEFKWFSRFRKHIAIYSSCWYSWLKKVNSPKFSFSSYFEYSKASIIRKTEKVRIADFSCGGSFTKPKIVSVLYVSNIK